MENSLHYKLRICHTIAYDVRQYSAGRFRAWSHHKMVW